MQEYKTQLLKRALAFAAIFTVVFFNAGKTLFGINRMTLDATSSWGPMVVAAAVVGAVYLALEKSTFLPFLSETVLPPSVLNVSAPTEATMNVTVGPAPNGASHAVYWAASPAASVVPNPMDAYSGFKNAGVVAVVGSAATLPLVCPASYQVPGGKTLDRHVHYRWVFPSGMLSKVYTEQVVCL